MTNNSPRCDKFTPDICVDDFEYPEQAILDEINKKKQLFDLMYAEVSNSSELASKVNSQTGFVCPSEIMFGRPKLARNKEGTWKVIVNAGNYTQTVRLEKCINSNKSCNNVNISESRCAQVYYYNRLLAFDKQRGFYMDIFRLPSNCNCLSDQVASGSNGSGTSRSRPSSSETTLSRVLWSILSR